MTRRTLLVVATVLLAACGGTNEQDARVTIPRGASVRVVAESLQAHGVIGNATWFRLRARMSGLDRKLKPGLYEFPARPSIDAVLTKLANGDAVQVRLTLPEGGTLFDLARAVESKVGIPRDSFLAAARDSALLREFKVEGSSAEGWLLPETYDFPALVNGPDILRRFLGGRQASWDSSWDARATSAGFTRAELLTLASIVEAEAKLPIDRPLVAGVYRNRLRIGMPLQADPGIQYAWLLRNGARKSRMYNNDYSYQSPYNTYLNPGLPPGPIGNPSSAAIEAVLSPSPLPNLYFVAGADGAHRFSRTYQEHLRTIRELRKETKD